MNNIFFNAKKILFISFIFLGCNGNSGEVEKTDKIQDDLASVDSGLNQNSKSDKEPPNLIKDTIAELLNNLKTIPTGNDYVIKGNLKTDILKFKSVAFGDMMHIGFVDKKNKEYDFGGNITKIELEMGATNPDDEDGYEANKKYVNKNFRVVWRTLKLNHKPKDEMEIYYEEYDQIIYLKQVD
jgi:hypothetical protein